MLKLYDYFRSSACFRVRIALNLKRIDFEAIPVHLVKNGGEQLSDAYRQINPHGLVPALQNGTQILTQSLAIIEYINEVYPEPPLLPSDPYERALARAFALSIAADIHPLNNLRVLNYLIEQMGISNDQKNQWYQHWIKKGLSALEHQLATADKTDTFCFGELPTIADICLVPQMYNARRFACDISAYPLLQRIDMHCQQHPAFAKAWPCDAVT